MTNRTLDYWREHFSETPTDMIIRDMSSAIAEKDADGLAFAMIVLVESMSKAEQNTIKNNLRQLCKHLHVINLVPPDSATYLQNINHWKEEIRNFQEAILDVLEKEPHFVPKVGEILKSVQDSAKDLALTKLGLPDRTILTMPDLDISLVLPDKIFNRKSMIHKPKVK